MKVKRTVKQNLHTGGLGEVFEGHGAAWGESVEDLEPHEGSDSDQLCNLEVASAIVCM